MPARFNRKIPGDPDGIEGPQRSNAAAVSVKRIRGLLAELAKQFHAHGAANAWKQGSVDLAQPVTAATHPHESTRQLLAYWRTWFARHYGKAQQAAVANGRWFPPPVCLQLTHLPDGTLTVCAKFTSGYMAQSDEVTVCHPRQPSTARPPLRLPSVHAATPKVPSPVVPAEQLGNVAHPWAPPGTQLLMADHVAGFSYYQGRVVIDLIRPGDALTLQPEPHNHHDALALAIFWQQFKLGYVPHSVNQPVARLLAMGVPLTARVVATPASQVPWQRVAFAVFMTPPAL